ncbi:MULTISPECIES: glutathione S-transferase family protein [Vibrio]|uniref:Glutathione S-transferase n=1 Tax=Vibrio bivalvicida TaxID=1276888 RepID=A0A177Y2Q2_9VIBR|nr:MULTISPECIES: glutathione S-transferase family protein [Vibrio]KLN63977.1 glutathione S-transferase [Vibrio sp. VPAP30]OAJ94765.1 glutathione S-transferase [Vibrio bivalvicida]
MLKVVSFKICPFVQRVTAALEAKQIPYEIEYISLKDKPQWFLDVSPNAQVPVVLTENGTVLFESDAIIEYIEDEYGPLEQDVSNEQRALDRAWSYLASKNYLAQCGTMSSKDKITFEQREKKLRTAFEKVEKQLLDNSKFFKSDTLSNVDIAWLPLLHRAAIVKERTGYDFLCGLPKTQLWQKAIQGSGLADKSVSSDFVEKFTDFYLDNTYLAEGKDVQRAGCSTSNCCD